jgi:hypothetical protein
MILFSIPYFFEKIKDLPRFWQKMKVKKKINLNINKKNKKKTIK